MNQVAKSIFEKKKTSEAKLKYNKPKTYVSARREKLKGVTTKAVT